MTGVDSHTSYVREFGKYSQLSVSPELGYFQELKMDE